VSQRAERRAIAALVAIFALLVQALPAFASASALAPGEQVICTGHGVQNVASGKQAPSKDSSAGACQHCVCVPGVGVPPPAAPATVQLNYSVVVRLAAARADLPRPARRPPRPPGQGPPTSEA
jgi:hypothetical protein